MSLAAYAGHIHQHFGAAAASALASDRMGRCRSAVGLRAPVPAPGYRLDESPSRPAPASTSHRVT